MVYKPTAEQLFAQRLKAEERFLAKAQEIHGDRFDYSRFVYVNAKTKGIIVCTNHGEFMQNPDRHLQNTHACPGCWQETRQNAFLEARQAATRHKPRQRPFKHWSKVTAESYLARLTMPEGLTVDMSDFQGFTKGTVSIHCPEHGVSTARPDTVMFRQLRCETCGKSRRHPPVRPFSEFAEAVKRVHGDRYEIPYPEEYENRKSWITLVCQTHGVFSKKGQKLLSGQGCAKCRIEEMKTNGTLPGGYNEQLFAQRPELAQRLAHVYYMRVGSVYKIGITRQAVGRRLISIRSTAQAEPELLDQLDCTLLEAYRLEQAILRDFHLQRTYGTWSTEIFREDVLAGVSLQAYQAAVRSEGRD